MEVELILNYVFILLVVIFGLYALFVFAHPVVRWLVTSLAIWGALLGKIPAFGELARENWILAIVVWQAVSTLSAASIWLAAVIGLGMTAVSEPEPEPDEPQPIVIPVAKPVKKSAHLTFDEWRRNIVAERMDK